MSRRKSDGQDGFVGERRRHCTTKKSVRLPPSLKSLICFIAVDQTYLRGLGQVPFRYKLEKERVDSKNSPFSINMNGP